MSRRGRPVRVRRRGRCPARVPAARPRSAAACAASRVGCSRHAGSWRTRRPAVAAAVEAVATRWSRSIRNAVRHATAPRRRRPRAESVRRSVDPGERRRRHRQGHCRRGAADGDDSVQGTAHRSADLAARRLPQDAGGQRKAAPDLRRRSGTGRRSRARSRPSRSRSSRATSKRRGAWRSCPTAACS